MTETCKTCKHWRDELHNVGNCCIRAPQLIPDPNGGIPQTWFPQTLSRQVCGEHEPTDIDKPDD